MLVDVFIVVLESRSDLPAALSVLFRNVQVLLGLNETFLNELKQRMQHWNEEQKIGDVFLHFAPFMKMYTTYVQLHDEATKVSTILIIVAPTICGFFVDARLAHINLAFMLL